MSSESLVDAAKERGNAFFKAGKYRDALKEYTEAISHDEENAAVLLLNRAAAYLALNEFRNGVNDCRLAIQKQGDAASAKAYTRQAKCFIGLGELTQAAEAAETAKAVSSASTQEQSQANEVLNQVRDIQKHLASFQSYSQEKNWTLASIALDQAQKTAKLTDSTSPTAWKLMRGTLCLQRGKISQAHSIAMDMYRADPSSTDALLLGARVMLANNDIQKAVSQVQGALRNDPDRQDVKQFLRKCKALSSLKDAANNAFKLNNTQEALQKYSELLTLADQDTAQDAEPKKLKAVIHSNRAILYSKLENYSASIADCNAALELDPGFVKPLRTRARANLSTEAYEEAVRDFKKAVEESTGSAEADSLRRELRSAEVDLKRSKKKDYYKILNVSKTANDNEIKKAFRKESLKHHPDKGGDEEKFKLCNEAYGVLSDDQKRRRYDSGVDDMDGMDMGGGMGGGMGGMYGGMGGAGGMHGVNLADLFGPGFANFDMGPGSGARYSRGGSNFHFG
ncbi:hypothetical protein MPSI1_000671 [Malassezia psittaci]|uniref:J domain-containing protein n=1 Tax=Malassezia psittaci TaxID=1821823 RepID=A0AAF0F8I8_9BASI|nr:hypothetical protein MPSI1_000671 [Malassezia psittaci]